MGLWVFGLLGAAIYSKVRGTERAQGLKFRAAGFTDFIFWVSVLALVDFLGFRPRSPRV